MKISRKAQLKVLRLLEEQAAQEAAGYLRRAQRALERGNTIQYDRFVEAFRSRSAVDCWLSRQIADMKEAR